MELLGNGASLEEGVTGKWSLSISSLHMHYVRSPLATMVCVVVRMSNVPTGMGTPGTRLVVLFGSFVAPLGGGIRAMGVTLRIYSLSPLSVHSALSLQLNM